MTRESGPQAGTYPRPMDGKRDGGDVPVSGRRPGEHRVLASAHRGYEYQVSTFPAGSSESADVLEGFAARQLREGGLVRPDEASDPGRVHPRVGADESGESRPEIARSGPPARRRGAPIPSPSARRTHRARDTLPGSRRGAPNRCPACGQAGTAGPPAAARRPRRAPRRASGRPSVAAARRGRAQGRPERSGRRSPTKPHRR